MHSDSDRPPAGGAPAAQTAPRVLVVHHSAMRALVTEHVLTDAGCLVRTLTDPRQLAGALAAFQPDLILTADPLVEPSGVELAAVTRIAGTTRLVPVVTGAVDHRRQPRGAAEATGAGDEPTLLAPEALVGAVTRRIASMRALSAGLAPAEQDTDPDSGLATRRRFMSVLGRVLGAPDIGADGNALLVVALDGVGDINRQWGTGAADVVADWVGRLIAPILGAGDLAAPLDDYRYALLIRRPGAAALQAVAETLCRTVAETPCEVRGNGVAVTVSIGMGPFSPPAEDAVAMLARAERACAEAAASGGGAIVLDQPGAVGATDDPAERQLVRSLVRALTDATGAADAVPGFRVLYQPVVAVRRQVMHYVEIMLCLADEDGELLQPADFLPGAERAGQRAEVDRWLMGRALATLVEQAEAQPRLRLLVCQAVATLTEDGRLNWLAEQINTRGLVERCPILDLNVRDLLLHKHLAGALIAGLRRAGIPVCLSGCDLDPVVLDLALDVKAPFVKLDPAVHQLRPDRMHHLIRRLSGQGGTEVIACAVDAHQMIAPVWASGAGYAQGAAIHGPLAGPDFDWDEVVTEQD